MAIDVADVAAAVYRAVGEGGEADLDLIAVELGATREVVAPPVRDAVRRDEPLLQSRKDVDGTLLYSLRAAGVALVFDR